MTTSGQSDVFERSAPERLQVFFLTGQSDPPRCALSPLQQAFIDALPLPEAAKLRLNFPYAADTAPWRASSLALASLNNVVLYLRSRRPGFARYGPSLLQQLERAEQTLILAGSSGLELLANLRLPREALRRVHVFAYGPVARGLPPCACTLVQGRGDWISRAWFHTVDHRVECSHMDYLESPEVLALCAGKVRELAGSSVVGVAS
jgi:hypothetical protein